MKTIYLIRHAEAVCQAGPRRCVSRTELPLDAVGREQAEALRRWGARQSLSAVYASPSLRCRQTAAALTEAPQIRAELLEMSVGVWENLTFEEIRQRWPKEYEERGRHLGTIAPPGGESFLEAGERLGAFLEEILERGVLAGAGASDGRAMSAGEGVLSAEETLFGGGALSAEETLSGEAVLAAKETLSGEGILSAEETLSGEGILSAEETLSGEGVLSAEEIPVGERSLETGEALSGEGVLPAEEIPAGERSLETGEALSEESVLADKKILAENSAPDEAVAVVAHGGIFRGWLCGVLGMKSDDVMAIRQPWCGITAIEYEDGRFTVRELGRQPTDYPGPREIEALYARCQTSQQVREHCRAVAQRAQALSLPPEVEPGFLRAACLLHDLCRADGRSHPAKAAEILNDRGYPVLADCIARHHDLGEGASPAAKLLYLADKLVQGTEPVTIRARFAASRKKCVSPEAVEAWETRFREALALEAKYIKQEILR